MKEVPTQEQIDNELLRQDIDAIFFKHYNALHDNFWKSEFEAAKEASEDVMKLLLTELAAQEVEYESQLQVVRNQRDELRSQKVIKPRKERG